MTASSLRSVFFPFPCSHTAVPSYKRYTARSRATPLISRVKIARARPKPQSGWLPGGEEFSVVTTCHTTLAPTSNFVEHINIGFSYEALDCLRTSSSKFCVSGPPHSSLRYCFHQRSNKALISAVLARSNAPFSSHSPMSRSRPQREDDGTQLEERFERVRESDEVDENMGFVRVQEGARREGWLINMHPTLLKDADYPGGKAAVDFYFIQDDGGIMQDWIRVFCRRVATKRFEGLIVRIVWEKKEDLKLPNHLMGHRRLYRDHESAAEVPRCGGRPGFLVTNREIVGEDIDDFEYTPKEGYEGPFIIFNEKDE
ncbi:hypothetical protein BDR03DRAFT_988206, partial [Suillus americanus]